MSPEQESFENLRRLLTLKRYEQPPPGYFDRLARRIIGRIEAGETGGVVTFSERISWEAPWLQRILMHLEAKPAIGAAFAAGLCVFLISGLVMSEKQSGQLPTIMGGGQGEPAASRITLAIDGSSPGLLPGPMQPSVNSTGGMPSFGPGSIFEAIGQPKSQIIKFPASGN